MPGVGHPGQPGTQLDSPAGRDMQKTELLHPAASSPGPAGFAPAGRRQASQGQIGKNI